MTCTSGVCSRTGEAPLPALGTADADFAFIYGAARPDSTGPSPALLNALTEAGFDPSRGMYIHAVACPDHLGFLDENAHCKTRLRELVNVANTHLLVVGGVEAWNQLEIQHSAQRLLGVPLSSAGGHWILTHNPQAADRAPHLWAEIVEHLRIVRAVSDDPSSIGKYQTDCYNCLERLVEGHRNTGRYDVVYCDDCWPEETT